LAEQGAPIPLVLHHRQPPAQRAARSRRWSTSPRPVGRPCDIGNQLIQPDTEHGTHSTHLCCSEYVNNAPSLNPLESCRAIPLGIRLPPAAIRRKPFSNGFQFQVPVPRITGCRTIASGEARAAAPAGQPPLQGACWLPTREASAWLTCLLPDSGVTASMSELPGIQRCSGHRVT
jgi:hypothetical protein